MSAPGAAEEAAKAGNKRRDGVGEGQPGSASSSQMP
jgi:hypothetical protein